MQDTNWTMWSAVAGPGYEFEDQRGYRARGTWLLGMFGAKIRCDSPIKEGTGVTFQISCGNKGPRAVNVLQRVRPDAAPFSNESPEQQASRVREAAQEVGQA